MGMPSPSSSKSWLEQNRSINAVAKEEFEEETNEAGRRLREKLQTDEGKAFNKDEVLDIAGSFDGSWHHRGFTSSHGVGVIMSVDTGEVLDAVSLSKDCQTCIKNKDKDDEWKRCHVESGLCEKNFDGPSSSMETAAAKILWSRSLEKHNMRYTVLLSDGDNKTLASINDNLKPYGDTKVEKLDCVNHVHKRMGKGLRELLKSNAKITGGRGGLTKPKIKQLTDYYKIAIMSNTTKSKDEKVIKQHIKSMKKSILASLYHSVYNKNPKTMHKYCPVEWCQYKKDINNKTLLYDHAAVENKRLPNKFLKHMLPLYERLSTDALLKGCVPGLTQNQNESFNATIWKRCPKERLFGASAVQRALTFAIVTWNSGKGYDRLLQKMGLSANWTTMQRMLEKDSVRVSDAGKREKKSEKARKRRSEKLQEEHQKRQKAEVEYQPGGF